MNERERQIYRDNNGDRERGQSRVNISDTLIYLGQSIKQFDTYTDTDYIFISYNFFGLQTISNTPVCRNPATGFQPLSLCKIIIDDKIRKEKNKMQEINTKAIS